MGKILDLYLSRFVSRYDKDGIIPYLSHNDFEGLKMEEHSFINSDNNKICYFYYYFDNPMTDKIVLFLHGIGPGHTAYISEINEICKKGYKVLTLDYTGCDKSEGENLNSINQPTQDVDELLKLLNLKEEILLIGHSLGGYTALNTININNNIHKAVVISGFYSFKKEICYLMRSPIFGIPPIRREMTLCKAYNKINNMAYLKKTTDKLLFIQSTDDPLIPYHEVFEYIQKKAKNNNLIFISESNKKHNPNYSKEAINYMNSVIGTYQKKVKSGEFDTFEKKQEYMKDKSAKQMTIQDENIWDKIFGFIESK